MTELIESKINLSPLPSKCVVLIFHEIVGDIVNTGSNEFIAPENHRNFFPTEFFHQIPESGRSKRD